MRRVVKLLGALALIGGGVGLAGGAAAQTSSSTGRSRLLVSNAHESRSSSPGASGLKPVLLPSRFVHAGWPRIVVFASPA
jgi:hypothetical protein